MRKFTLDQALAMAKTIGIKYMTFKDVHLPRTDSPETIAANRRKIEAAGITIMGGGTITMKNEPEQIRKDFAYAKLAGFPLIYVAPEPAALDFIEQMVKEHDIKLAIHNHGPEDKAYPGAGRRVQRHQEPRPTDGAVRRHRSHEPHRHRLRAGDRRFQGPRLRPARQGPERSEEQGRQVEVGRGVFDFPRLFRTLLQIGYAGQVGLEYEIKEDDPLPGMIESIAYMRGVLAALTQTT